MEGGKINNMNSQLLHAFFLASAWQLAQCFSLQTPVLSQICYSNWPSLNLMFVAKMNLFILIKKLMLNVDEFIYFYKKLILKI
jgi:hypothetical protein